jgi:hypothetical protein
MCLDRPISLGKVSILLAHFILGIQGVSIARFMHCEIPNPEFPIAVRIGPMVMVPGHKRIGLE